MDNAYLDAFLKAFPNDCSAVSRSIFMWNTEILRSDYPTAKKLFIEKHLIAEQQRNYLPPSLRLTPLGTDFPASGGFAYEQKGNESSLMLNTLATTTILVSVIATILSIVAIVLSIYRV